MPKNFKRYTKEEVDVLLQCVKESPTNLRQAFRNASYKLKDRTAESLQIKWYSQLSKQYSYIITTGSSKGFSNNIKNDVNKTHKLKPFQVIVKHMLDLSDKDREKVLNFFK